MKVFKSQAVALVCLFVGITVFFASKMIVWKPTHAFGDWKGDLLEAVADADQISVYKVGDENTRLALGGKDQIQKFLHAISINESVSETVMMPGRFRIIFESGESSLVSIEIVGNTHLRWSGGDWPSDAKLTPSSAASVQAWLVDIGVIENVGIK